MGRPDKHDKELEELHQDTNDRDNNPPHHREPPPKQNEKPDEGSKLARALTGAAAAAVLLFASTFAHADPDPAFHCDVLGDHTPFVCVHNSMKRSIGNISCSGFWGTTNMSVPNASIPAGHTTVIKFDAGKCKKQIDIETKDGHSFTIKGFDFEKNFNLDVNDQ